MPLSQEKIDWYKEAEKRNLLSPEKQEWWDQAKQRGMVDGTQQDPYSYNDPKEMGPPEVGLEEPPSGFVKGLRDPVDALAQILYKVVPEDVRKSGDKLNNWLAEKLPGIIEKIPEGGLDEQLKGQEEEYQASRKAEGDEGFDWDRMAGSMVSTMAVPGSAMAKPASALGKVGAGTASGAGYGMLTPVTEGNFWEEKGKQAATGAVVGGALSAPGAIYQKGKELVSPLFKKTRKEELEKFLIDRAGPERGKIIQALESRKPMVGGTPTTGQAIAQAQNPGQEFGSQFGRLEKELSKVEHSGSKIKQKYGSQAAGREKIVQDIAKTPDDMAAAIKKRKETSEPWYKMVEESSEQVKTSPVISKIDDLIKRNPNESSLVKPLSDIKGKIEAGTSAREMASLSKEVGKMMEATTPGGAKEFNVQALDQVKKLLDKQIGRSEAAHKIAQASFKEGSKPINKMEVGGYLKGKLVGETEDEKARSFIKALEDAPTTLKRSTGFKRYKKLDEVLDPDQVKGLNKVAEDLITQAKLGKLGKDAESAISKMPGEVTNGLPRVLSTPVVITNHILKMIGKDKSPEYKKVLTDILTDPDKVTKILRKPESEAQRKLLVGILKELSILGGTKIAEDQLRIEVTK